MDRKTHSLASRKRAGQAISAIQIKVVSTTDARMGEMPGGETKQNPICLLPPAVTTTGLGTVAAAAAASPGHSASQGVAAAVLA
jgi:hypothetical protein